MRVPFTVIAVGVALIGCASEPEHKLIGKWTPASINACGGTGETMRFRKDMIIFRVGANSAPIAAITGWSEPQADIVDLGVRQNVSQTKEIILGREELWRFRVADGKARFESWSLDGERFTPIVNQKAKDVFNLIKCG